MITINLKHFSLLAVMWLACESVLAQTTLRIDENGNSNSISVSKDNPVVIEFAKGKIHRIDGRIGADWTMDTDEASLKAMQEIGKAIITPVTDKPFTLLLTRDDKRTFRIKLEPSKTGAEQHIIVATNEDLIPVIVPIDPEIAKTFAKAESRDKLIMAFLKVMAGNESRSGFNKTATAQKITLWQETDITKIQVWSGRSLQGETWLVRNATEQTLTLDERNFYTDGVAAISINQAVLMPGQETRVYIVMEPK